MKAGNLISVKRTNYLTGAITSKQKGEKRKWSVIKKKRIKDWTVYDTKNQLTSSTQKKTNQKCLLHTVEHVLRKIMAWNQRKPFKAIYTAIACNWCLRSASCKTCFYVVMRVCSRGRELCCLLLVERSWVHTLTVNLLAKLFKLTGARKSLYGSGESVVVVVVVVVRKFRIVRAGERWGSTKVV